MACSRSRPRPRKAQGCAKTRGSLQADEPEEQRGGLPVHGLEAHLVDDEQRHVEVLAPAQAGGLNLYAYADADPLNRIDPVGLYEIDVHYYLTYFLARMAGLPPRLALTIALAAQYVDDNPVTEPLWNAGDARRFYHFTQSPQDDKTTDPATRFEDPRNEQLDKLLRPFTYAWLTPCQRAQFLGEFLHAFEDSFSHRDEDNVPYPPNFSTQGWVGPLAPNHDPDQTYDIRDFQWNEERTMQMAREVFERLRSLYGLQAYDKNGFPIEFEDIEPTIRAFILTGKEAAESAPQYQDWWGDDSKTTYEIRKAAELNEKVNILNQTLNAYGMESIPEYDVGRAAGNRMKYFEGLGHDKPPAPDRFEGILFNEDALGDTEGVTGLMEE